MQQPPLHNAIIKQNHSGLPVADFLKQVTGQHPYFIPAHFFLLQQMQEDAVTYHLQAAKTAILFNNPHWLHFQLQNKTVNEVEQETKMTPMTMLPIENPDSDDVVVNIPATETIVVAENTTVCNEPAIEQQMLTPEELMLAENADNDDDAVTEEEIEPIKITIPQHTISSREEALTFEPMHLVDYFASQGIKLSDEVQNADKLGKQLKSFTDWLKTMKKIHTPDTETSAGISDMVIQTLAAKSNTEGETVTEAMAEVLTQQGKAAKAVEVYKKLSLLNPAKSAFFAAKIEQLKG